MGMFRVVVKKEIPFQGRSEQFSNVYVLNTGVFEGFDDNAAIDGLVAIERAVHAPQVRFVRGESYGINPVTGDNPRFGKDLDVRGTGGGGDPMYHEAAILVKMELPRAGGLVGIGRRRMLRKWLHIGSGPVALDANQRAGQDPIGQNVIDLFDARYAEPLFSREFGGGRISAPNGDRPTSRSIHPWVEHHQFHAGKKRPA